MKYSARHALWLVLLLCAPPLCFSQAAPPPEASRAQSPQPELNRAAWKPYTSASGGFSAIFPGTPVEETKPLPAPSQNLLMNMATVRTLVEYSVGYTDFPAPIEGTDRVATFLANARDSGVSAINAHLIEDRDESFMGHPGRVFKVEFGDGYFLTCRELVVKNRLYMVMATTYSEKKAPPEIVQIYKDSADRFFNSFRLLATGNKEHRTGNNVAAPAQEEEMRRTKLPA